MGEHDRRAVIRMATGAAVLAVLGTQAVPAIGATARIAPPAATMLFARRLDRELPGDARIVVERDFAVRFRSDLQGFEVTGHQHSARVSAPDWLGELARLEERRVEEGLFPLRLDNAGVIVTGETVARSAEVDAALRNVSDRFGFAQGVAPEEGELAQLVEELHRAGSGLISELPLDLFAPVETRREETQRIDLPWGDMGSVTTSFSAVRDTATGLMREAHREIVTVLGNATRRTAETWTLRTA